MNIRDISKPITAASLNESLARKFGQKINLEAFTLERLEDTRNKIRTRMSQVETNESFNSVHTETYQKSKLFLEVLTAEINERNALGEKSSSRAQQKAAGAALSANRGKTPKSKLKGASKEMAGMSKKELEKYASTKHKGLPKKKNEGVIREGAEESAELVMASKDMVDRVTGWMEDTAEMQTESMLELADSIRDEMGSEQSELFVGTVKPSLEALYTALEATREALIAGVGVLTGETTSLEPMGDEVDAVDDTEFDAEADTEFDADAAVGDDDAFAAAEPATGGEEGADRMKRESVERSRRLGNILSKKK